MVNTAASLQNRFEAGIALQRLGRLDEAASCYRNLLREAPLVAQVHYNLGLVLRAQDLLEAAADSFRTALRLQSAWPEALANLANTAYQLGRLDEAEQCCRQALRMAPHLAEAHANWGNVLRDRGRFEESIAAYRQALQGRPSDHETNNNLGNSFKDLGRLEEAEAAYRAVLRQQPDNAKVRYNLGTLYLAAGRFPEGWEGFEYRWLMGSQGARPFTGPAWAGQAIEDDQLLLHAEQGLGDTIQFCRYARLVAERAKVTLLAPPELRRLLATLHPAVTVVSGGDVAPGFLFHCPLMSLPLVLGTTIDTIPAETPYLHAEPGRVAEWRQRLAGLGGLRVGLVWAGNPTYPADALRSVPFGTVARLLERPGVCFISLQKGKAAAQNSPGIHDWTADLTNLADTAALIETLDLVIGVDTAVVHLAGALGKPVWLLNRFDTDWRWLRDREDSPWYPTLRQFRQSRPGDWDGVMDRVSRALDERAGTPGA